ncbi:carbohydrate sulfotransferase 8-like [Clavelina lepadiformis]|uniref:carbohydrate sulfotransferase 8-like n=1 Tax=Clavelina lepadiformis TaxID=159417 RepID=UPI0040434ADA
MNRYKGLVFTCVIAALIFVYFDGIYIDEHIADFKTKPIVLQALYYSSQLQLQLFGNNMTGKVTDAMNNDVTVTKPLPPAVVEKRFGRRLEQAENACMKRGISYLKNWEIMTKYGPPVRYFVASHSHRAMMCLVLKAGSSTWNNFFWRIRAPDESRNSSFWAKTTSSNSEAFRALSREKKMEILQDENATRLMNVRHPLARMISGWGDKFTKQYYYKVLFKRYPGMLKYPNKHKTWKGWPEDGRFMEFADYARYMADYGTRSLRNLDEHFLPMLKRCDPCYFPFNYITKLETFATDAAWIVDNKLNVTIDTITSQNVFRKTEDPAAMIKEYFSQLEPNVIERILQIYKVDMETFGYTFNTTTLTAGGWGEET